MLNCIVYKKTQLENAVYISSVKPSRLQHSFQNHILMQKITVVQVSFFTTPFKILLKLVMCASPEVLWKDHGEAIMNRNEPDLAQV